MFARAIAAWLFLILLIPFSPQKIATIKGDAYFDVIPYGDVLIAFIDKGVLFFDIKDPLNAVKAGSLMN